MRKERGWSGEDEEEERSLSQTIQVGCVGFDWSGYLTSR